MTRANKWNFLAGLLLFALSFTAGFARAADSPPSWNEGPAKQAIVAFVDKVTRTGSPAFEQIVKDWIASAKHPKTGRLFTQMAYQPMIELLAYLRANGFKTFIVSGGGIEFMRPWADKLYGVPPEQVIGSNVKTQFELRDGKPVAINQHIGRWPIAAFGNSDGDREMLEYTQGGAGARLELLVLHDDAAREYAYGPANGLPDVKLGAFTQALYEQAKANGWTVVSMKDDWKRVFAFEK